MFASTEFGDPMDIATVRDDLLAEQEDLRRLLVELTDEEWEAPTTSPRWRVREQVSHLAYFDSAAVTAIEDADGFARIMDRLWELVPQGGEAVDAALMAPYVELPPDELLAAWDTNRAALAAAARGLGEADRVPWFGPSMGSKSFLTARLMEAWAHGLDVADATGRRQQPTDRLAHIARLGVNTRAWSYQNRGLEPPDVPVAVRLTAPSGQVWTYGAADAAESIEGPAEDFCRVVAQRRHVDDTALVVTGDAARDWMVRAQLFAGPPTDGPAPADSAS